MRGWVEGSVLWDDFGGNVKDEDVEECAARELYEETLGTLISKDDVSILAASLRNEQYVFRIENTFLVKFDWNPKVLYEFSKIHFQMKCLQKISAGYPLFPAQRLEMCKYKWMESRKDGRLQTLLNHPAVLKERRFLPASVIANANARLNVALQASSFSISGEPSSCLVVKGVKSEFLEKEVLELYSLQQLFCCLQLSGLCVKGQSIQLSESFNLFLGAAKKSFCMGLTDCADFEEECKS
jgi:hypothetical protein